MGEPEGPIRPEISVFWGWPWSQRTEGCVPIVRALSLGLPSTSRIPESQKENLIAGWVQGAPRAHSLIGEAQKVQEAHILSNSTGKPSFLFLHWQKRESPASLCCSSLLSCGPPLPGDGGASRRQGAGTEWLTGSSGKDKTRENWGEPVSVLMSPKTSQGSTGSVCKSVHSVFRFTT